MLPYKSYYCIHNNDSRQNFKVYVFGEFAISRCVKIPPNAFIYTDFWELLSLTGVKYYWFNLWPPETKNSYNTHMWDKLKEKGFEITRKEYKKYFQNKRFNKSFEDLLVSR